MLRGVLFAHCCSQQGRFEVEPAVRHDLFAFAEPGEDFYVRSRSAAQFQSPRDKYSLCLLHESDRLLFDVVYRCGGYSDRLTGMRYLRCYHCRPKHTRFELAVGISDFHPRSCGAGLLREDIADISDGSLKGFSGVGVDS